MKTLRHLTHLALAALAFTPALAPAAGPVSEYYLTAGDQTRLLRVQGSTVELDIAATTQFQYAIAVDDTVRTLGRQVGENGREYSLAGVPSGAIYAYPTVGGQMLDGTTDGTNNYGLVYTTGQVYRFAQDWTSPTLLFTAGDASASRLGITYDGTNNSLWVSGWSGGTTNSRVENYSMSGTLLSFFSTGHNLNAALALDPADNTLWLVNPHPSDFVLEQYSKAGTLLNTQSFPGAPYSGYNVLGGEFQVVPEPGSGLLLCAGGLGLLLRRRRATAL